MLYTELAPKLAATASVAKGRGFFANALSHLNPNPNPNPNPVRKCISTAGSI